MQRTFYKSAPLLRRLLVFALFACLCLPAFVSAQTDPEPTMTDTTIPVVPDSEMVIVAPPTSVIAEDVKYDDGNVLKLTWVPSVDDVPEIGSVTGYKVYRSVGDGEFKMVAELLPGSNSYLDRKVSRDSTYRYQVTAISENFESDGTTTQGISPKREWLDFDRAYLFLIALVFSAAVITFVELAKRGRDLYIRKISGLEAIDEAVGRATEMGRPVLFIPGIHDMDDVQTLAALTILGRVARTIADYDTRIYMPVSRSLVMTAGRETIKAAYMAAGRPDAYIDDMVSYVTDEQFGYVAAVDGVMVRERPATIFLLGAFFAESLILAETGNSVGAIQIAGTARPAQLPFFIAACDFTLIGEELFAASAYLSGEPRQLGSLKGQDVGKGIAMIIIIVGVVAATLATAFEVEIAQDVYDFLRKVFSSN